MDRLPGCLDAATLDVAPDLPLRCIRCGQTLREGSGEATWVYCPRRAEAPVEEEGGLDTLTAEATDEVQRITIVPARPPTASRSGSGVRGPARFGRYEVTGEIARGGMGVVYRAWDLELEREVALKVLLAGVWANEKQVARFLREARALAKLDHPGIIRVFDLGTTDEGVAWFAMELVDGPSLREVVQDRGPVPVDEACRLLVRVARALHRMHSDGFVHRDIKPSNILVTPTGDPLLTDFGLVADADGDAELLTQVGQVMGTPAYMAPEQRVGAHPDTDWVRSDIYSLGATLFELLAGAPPEPHIGALHRLPEDVPSPLEWVTQKALRFDARERYATASDLADDIERFLAHEPVVARKPSTLVRARLFLRRNPWVGPAGIAGLLGIGAVFMAGVGGYRAAVTSQREAFEIEQEARWDRVRQRIDSLRSQGEDAEADEAFRTFAEDPELAGSRALARAWLYEGDRHAKARDFDPALDAFGTAYTTLSVGDIADDALERLLMTFAQARRWDEVQAALSVAAVDHPELASRADETLALPLALARNDFARARDLLDEEGAALLDVVGRGAATDQTPPEPAEPLIMGQRAAATANGLSYVATGGSSPNLYAIVEGNKVPAHPPTMAAGAWIADLLGDDLDGDGEDELVAAIGPPSGYEVRVFDTNADGTLTLRARRRVGEAMSIARWGDRIAVGTANRQPNRDLFPAGDPYGGPAGVHLLRLRDDELAAAGFIAAPMSSAGRPLAAEDLYTGDVDGDGVPELVVDFRTERGHAEVGIAWTRSNDTTGSLLLGGLALHDVRQLDDDEARELLVGRGGEAFALGVGTDWLGPRAIRELPVPGDGPYRQPQRLRQLGLRERAAQSYEVIATATDDAEGWRQAARLWSETDRHARAATAWKKAAALSGQRSDLEAQLSEHVRAVQFQRARTLRATLGLETRNDATDEVVFDFGAPLAKVWSRRHPLVRRDARQGALIIEAPRGAGPVARFGLQGPMPTVRATLDVERLEWGAVLTVDVLAGELTVPLRIEGGGSGGFLTATLSCADGRHTVQLPNPDGLGAITLTVAREPGGSAVGCTIAHDGRVVVRELVGEVDDAPWSVEFGSPQSDIRLGALVQARLTELSVRGAELQTSRLGRPPSGSMYSSLLRIRPRSTMSRLAALAGPATALTGFRVVWGTALSQHGDDRDVRETLLRDLPYLDGALPDTDSNARWLLARRGAAWWSLGDVDAARADLQRVANAVPPEEADLCRFAEGVLAEVAMADGKEVEALGHARRSVRCAEAPELQAEYLVRRPPIASRRASPEWDDLLGR